MAQDASRRAFLKRLAKYGYTAPVILTVLSREARANLSGYPTDLPPDGSKDDVPPGGYQSPTPPVPGATPSPAAGSDNHRPWYHWFQQLFRW
ncbi:MAG: hypothetical protein JXP34_28455 [Planctomycetes bacterium]|nr:hypothetical protein [Planctomycetota bacterium]